MLCRGRIVMFKPEPTRTPAFSLTLHLMPSPDPHLSRQDAERADARQRGLTEERREEDEQKEDDEESEGSQCAQQLHIAAR